ncbi:MAG: hypothetical protein AAFO82_17890 [Bacteroidota bacterium]
MKNRRLSHNIKKNTEQLDLNERLLQQLLIEQEQLLQTTSNALHSSLSSKLHAINLSVFQLKKTKLNTPSFEQHIHVLLETTKATLSELEQLASDTMPYSLQVFGLNAALQELASHYSAPLAINIEGTAIPIASSKQYYLYRLLKAWIEEVVETYQTTQIQIVWEAPKQFIYNDNGSYPTDLKIMDERSSILLAIVGGQLVEEQYSLNGRRLVVSITG